MKLIDYLPPILKEIYEFRLMFEADDCVLEKAREEINRLNKELFIYTAENEGLERLEKVLNLFVSSDDSIEYRRFRILTKINGSTRNLVKRIENIVGPDFTIDYYWREYRLVVKLPLKNKKYLEAVRDMLERTVPLNIIIETTLKYNTHNILKGHTHNELSQYTHRGLITKEGL